MQTIDLNNQTDLTLNRDLLEKIVLFLTNEQIELIVVEDEQMKALNLAHRGKAKSTDVLSFPVESFPFESEAHLPLGSIVISSDFVKEKAKTFGHTNNDEFALLFIHGMLHLLGFDHETDDGEMRAKESEIIKYFNLPSSLIIRTEEF